MDKKILLVVGLFTVVGLVSSVVLKLQENTAQAQAPLPKAELKKFVGDSPVPARAAEAKAASGSGSASGAGSASGSASAAGGAGKAPAGVTAQAVATGAISPAPPVEAPKMAMLYVAKHELYTAKFVNQGATLTSFELTKFEESDRSGPMNVIGREISDPGSRPFAVELPGDTATQDLLYGLHDCTLTLRPNTEFADTLTCVWSDKKRIKLTKRVTFIPNSYVLNVEVELENLTEVTLTSSVAFQMTAYQAQVKGGGCFEPPPDVATPICLVKESVERNASEDILKKFQGRQRIDGDVQWSGVDHRYFLIAAAVRDGADVQDPKLLFRANSCELVVKNGGAVGGRVLPKYDFTLGKREAGKAGKSAFVRFAAYMGPKLHKQLETVTIDKGGQLANIELERSVDFWILAVLCKPMLWLLNFFYGFVGNYGIAIILLTLVVKIITFWPSQKSYRSMEGMKQLKKPMEEVRAKYAHDKSKLNAEMMALYRTHKINPLGGCLPLVIQMPIWIALYRTIYSSVEIYQQPFFGWIQDLSAQDPYYVLPLLLGAVMFVQQRMTPSTGDNAQMRLMLYGMPVLFTAMMLFFPSGLVLYIFVNTVLSIAQQWLIKRSMQTARA